MVSSGANIVPGGSLHPQIASNLTSLNLSQAQVSCIANESMSLKREHTTPSSLIITPQLAPAIKIQKLPLEKTPEEILPTRNSLTTNITSTNQYNEFSQVKTPPISKSSTVACTSINSAQTIKNGESQKLCNLISKPSNEYHVQSKLSSLDTDIASPKLTKINQLNDALTAINPR